MSVVFADTVYYIGLISLHDEHHAAACEFTDGFGGRFVTTAWVLTEAANRLARAAHKRRFLDLLTDLRSDPRVLIAPPGQELLDQGLELYSDRLDKDWSLTDCISFVVMRQQGLTDALTGDHHFEQAGFRVLLK